MFWLIFSCPADPSIFSQGQTWIYQWKLQLLANFSVHISRHGVQLLLHPSLHPSEGWLIPHCQNSSTSSKSRIDYSHCPPFTPVPADGSRLEGLMYSSWQAQTSLRVMGVTIEVHNLTQTRQLFYSLKNPQVPPQRKPKRWKQNSWETQ